MSKDSTESIPRRAFESELRVTYRDSILETEKIVGGKFEAAVKGPGDTANISLEEGMPARLHVKIGDRIVFNVQGLLLPAIVGSIRRIDQDRYSQVSGLFFPGVCWKPRRNFLFLLRMYLPAKCPLIFSWLLFAGIRIYPSLISN